MSTEYAVLNSGSVRLIETLGSDIDVVNAARVSFASYSREMDDKSIGLIGFLMKNKHATPFEHVIFKFHIKCPIFVAREWFRHRWSSFNEMSMRYYVPDTIHYYMPNSKAIRQQVGKPGHYSFNLIKDVDLHKKVIAIMQDAYNASDTAYRKLLELGLAKEVARSVLPVGQYTEFIWTVNARSLMNFLSLRNDTHAQQEIREYAEILETLFSECLPITYEAFLLNGRESI
jgi:thymidylate synthase (FAD)